MKVDWQFRKLYKIKSKFQYHKKWNCFHNNWIQSQGIINRDSSVFSFIQNALQCTYFTGEQNYESSSFIYLLTGTIENTFTFTSHLPKMIAN